MTPRGYPDFSTVCREDNKRSGLNWRQVLPRHCLMSMFDNGDFSRHFGRVAYYSGRRLWPRLIPTGLNRMRRLPALHSSSRRRRQPVTLSAPKLMALQIARLLFGSFGHVVWAKAHTGTLAFVMSRRHHRMWSPCLFTRSCSVLNRCVVTRQTSCGTMVVFTGTLTDYVSTIACA